MSRYVQIELALDDLEFVEHTLRTRGLAPQRNAHGLPIMLRGSLECTGEPVEIRLEAGTLNTIEDFGFARDEGGMLRLVCGELDREILVEQVLVPLRHAWSLARTHQAAAALDMQVHSEPQPDGSTRLRLLPRRRP